MADPTGFEPAISSVTGWHVGPLHHGSAASRKNSTSPTARPMRGLVRAASTGRRYDASDKKLPWQLQAGEEIRLGGRGRDPRLAQDVALG